MWRPFRLSVEGILLIGADAPGSEPSSVFESPLWPEAVAAFEAEDMTRARRVGSRDLGGWPRAHARPGAPAWGLRSRADDEPGGFEDRDQA